MKTERWVGTERVMPWLATALLCLLAGHAPAQGSRAADREALVALYNATGGPNWKENTNWLSDEPIGEWHGVTVDDSGRVIGLRLRNNQLTGSIPAELGGLARLQSLSFYSNRLTGVIPPELGRLSNLEYLWLIGNELTGNIPAALGNLSNLGVLELHANQLSGSIPRELGNLSNLRGLSLDRNRLSGRIPEELGRLSSLKWLGLSGNQLGGSIPAELGNLSSLQSLYLHGNQLSGEIPPELGGLSNLQRLWLHANQLSGAIPEELGRLDSLKSLYLGGNHLSGSVRRELGNLSNLQELDLSRNELTDPLPHTLANLENLANFTFGINLGLCAPADAVFQDWLRNIPNENPLPGPAVINTTCSATAARNHNVILRVVRVTPDWLTYADTAWTGAVVHKQSEVLQFYEVAIWEEVSAVHFYRFPNRYWGEHFGSDEETIAYREQFLIRKYTDMPEAHTEERSAFLKAAFKDIASHLVRQHPDSDHHLMYSGHGGPGGQLFAALMYPDHANEFLNFWSTSLGRKLGVIDMGGPCNKGGFSDLENFCESTRYYIASDMPNGGYVADNWAIDKYFDTNPETQYHRLFRNGESLEEALRGKIDLWRQRYEYSRNNMITNQVQQASYLYSCAAFQEFSPGFKSFLGSAGVRYGYNSDDLYNYLIDNGAEVALVEQFNKIIIHRADNRDFFEWSKARNGMLMPGPIELGGEGVDRDRDPLVALYIATDGANWANNTNWLSGLPLSEWYGVTTDADGRVTKLNLANNGLTGEIPRELGNLALLEELLLHNNQLTGTFPPSLTNLRALELFSFYGNTDLVVPDDPALRTWLNGITEVRDHDYIAPEKISSLFVPVILTASGQNNSFFTSELTLTNRGDREARLKYTYTADAGGESGTATEVLAPGQQKIQPDALKYLRGLGIPIPHSGNRIGTLRVEVPESSEMGVSVRTTTSVPEGRAGLAYPGIATTDGFEEAVYLCGLRQNSQDRSNVAFQNMGAPGQGTVSLRTTVYSGEAENRSSHVLPEVTLAPGGFHQYNGILNRAGFDNGYVRVERVEGTAPFYAYGVINDQVNSDGSFVFPVRESSLVGKRGQTLPVIIETRAFSSELTVTNFSPVAKTVDFRFVAEAVETDDNSTSFSLDLEAGEQRILPEIVNWLRQQNVEGVGLANRDFVGALFATVAEEDMSGIVIGARTGSPDKRGGQYSLFYNGVPYGSASVESAWIYGLQQNAENRSNLALVNTGEIDDSSSIFEITIYDGSGESQPRTRSVTLGPRRWTQENGILGNISQGYVQVRKTSGNNPFITYGVINDGGKPGQRSGDGTFLLAQE